MSLYSPSAYAASDPTTRLNLRVVLIDDLPPQQDRWRVAFRILLIVPQIVVYVLVALATLVILILSWCAALATGRVPDGLRSFLEYYARWGVRFNAYFFLLTDQYPPFNGDPSSTYPVEAELPPSGDLNRMAVLLRLVIAIPAGFVSAALGAAGSIFYVVFWIAALILGRLPEPIFRAVAVVTRYNARLSGYMLLLTSEYPWGWKGDDPSPTTPSVSTLENTTDYWTPSQRAIVDPATVVSSPEKTYYDFSLSGWSQSWLWIMFVVGALFEVFYQRR